MNILEEINDGTLFIRKISMKDKKFLFTSLNKKIITKYLLIDSLLSLNHSKNLIKKYLKDWSKNKQFCYIIEIIDKGLRKKIGLTNLWNINWRNKRAEIGIWLLPKYWNKGYGKKTINIIISLAFDFLDLYRLEVHIVENNSTSINLFEQCGFKKEVVLENYLFINGKFCNAVYLSLIRSFA